MYRIYNFILVSLLVGMSTVLVAQEQSITRLEQRLLQKIELYLTKVLPRDAFSANVTIFAEPAQSLRLETTGEAILPGLEPFDNRFFIEEGEIDPLAPFPGAASGTQTNGGVLYRNFLIKDVSVDLTIDETISDVTISAIQNAIGNQLDTAYPDIVNISIIPADFSRVRQAARERLERAQQLSTSTQAASEASESSVTEQPSVIISNIIPQPEVATEPQQPIIIQQPAPENNEPQPPVIVSNIIPEVNTNSEVIVAGETNNSFLTNFMRESSLIWYGLLIFLAILFFALILFGILIVVLRQDRPQSPGVVFRDAVRTRRQSVQEADDINQNEAPPPPPVRAARTPQPLAKDVENTSDAGAAELAAVATEEKIAEAERRRKELQKKKSRQLPDIVEQIDFIKLFLKSPLASRDYFLNLSNQEKNNLLLAFRSESARRRFNSLDEGFRVNTAVLEEFEDEESIENFRRDVFKRSIRNLRDYDALITLETTDPISRLSLLSEKEVESVFSRLESDQLVGISSYVDGKVLVNYLKHAPQDRKAELLKLLNRPIAMSEADLDIVKKDIDYYVDELASRIFTPKAERELLNETILKNAEDSKEIIEALREEDPGLYKRYRKYALTFEDFLEDNSEASKRTVEKLDNDLVSTAFLNVPMPIQQRIFSRLNERRRQVILSAIGSKRGTLGEDVIRVEREKLLDTYRAFASY